MKHFVLSNSSYFKLKHYLVNNMYDKTYLVIFVNPKRVILKPSDNLGSDI